MFEKIVLEGTWLIVALGGTFIAGVILSQTVKDKVFGVPSALRSALKVAEKNALTSLKSVQSKAVADVVNIFSQAVPKPAVAPAVAAVAAPVVVQAAAPAAPAAQPLV